MRPNNRKNLRRIRAQERTSREIDMWATAKRAARKPALKMTAATQLNRVEHIFDVTEARIVR